MTQTLVALLAAPLLTAASTLAARRWGPRTGGVVSAFPAIVGPVLFILAVAHGAAFAARAAAGTLLGLVALSAFALAYGRTATRGRRGWRLSLLAGWVAAAVVSGVVGTIAGGAGPLVGVAVAVLSLAAAHRGLPAPAHPVPAAVAVERSVGIRARMALTAGLVVTLAVIAGATGPVLGGMLAALPVLASILAVLSHREAGAEATVVLLRGMLAGMAGFVVFCATVAVLVTHGSAPAFAAATGAAVMVQLWVGTRRVSPDGCSATTR